MFFAWFQFLILGSTICRDAWQYLHGVGERRLKAVKDALIANGPLPRDFYQKGGMSKAEVMETKDTMTFLNQLAEVHGLDIPGRVPGELLKTNWL